MSSRQYLARSSRSFVGVNETGARQYTVPGAGINETTVTSQTRSVAGVVRVRASAIAGPLVSRSAASVRVTKSADTTTSIHPAPVSAQAGRIVSAVSTAPIVTRMVAAQAGRALGVESSGPFKTQQIAAQIRVRALDTTLVSRNTNAQGFAGFPHAASSVIEELQRGVDAKPRAVAGSEQSSATRDSSVSTRVSARGTVDRNSAVTVVRSVTSTVRATGALVSRASRYAGIATRRMVRVSETSVQTHQRSVTGRSSVRTLASTLSTRPSSVQGRAYAHTSSTPSVIRDSLAYGRLYPSGRIEYSHVSFISITGRAGGLNARLVSGRFGIGRLCVTDFVNGALESSDFPASVLAIKDQPSGYVDPSDEVLEC